MSTPTKMSRTCTVKDLRAMCRAMGLSERGTKSEIMHRLQTCTNDSTDTSRSNIRRIQDAEYEACLQQDKTKELSSIPEQVKVDNDEQTEEPDPPILSPQSLRRKRILHFGKK